MGNNLKEVLIGALEGLIGNIVIVKTVIQSTVEGNNGRV